MGKVVKTIKALTISTVYNTLMSAKVTKCSSKEKYAVIKVMSVLKPAATALSDFAKDAADKLKPENFEDLQAKIAGFDGLGDTEKQAVNEAVNAYNKSVDECCNDEAQKEVEVELDPLTEEAFSNLVDSNDFAVATIMMLQEVLM